MLKPLIKILSCDLKLCAILELEGKLPEVNWGRLVGSVGGVIAVCACLSVLFIIVRSGAGHNYRYTNLKTNSFLIRPSVVGRQISLSGTLADSGDNPRRSYVFLMPSCQSCAASAVDARIAEQESSALLVFVYPDVLDSVPSEQLPAGSNSVALSTQDVQGLSSLDYGLVPAILALDRDNRIIAQTEVDETFEQFRERVEK